jgi:hypothetical protein
MGSYKKIKIWDWAKIQTVCYEHFISKKQVALAAGIPYRTVTGTMCGRTEGESVVIGIMEAINRLVAERGAPEPFDFTNLGKWELPLSVQKAQAEINMKRLRDAPGYGQARRYDRSNTFEMKKREDAMRAKFIKRIMRHMGGPDEAETVEDVQGEEGHTDNSDTAGTSVSVAYRGESAESNDPLGLATGGTKAVDRAEEVRIVGSRIPDHVGGDD